MDIDVAGIVAEAKCFMCHGVSLAEAIELALLNRISVNVSGGLGSGGYPAGTKFYRALISQDGFSAPTAQILQNTLGSVPTWIYNGGGNYSLTLTGGFPLGKTFCLMTCQGSGLVVGIEPFVDNINVIYTQANVAGDYGMYRISCEVIVFP